ncbi:MAG: DUF2155 domain-containing protein [Holosporales bacterium]|jgi:hypothetical protein|nr:DUF2155 domain-containing protein [Holosporales bacterium]
MSLSPRIYCFIIAILFTQEGKRALAIDPMPPTAAVKDLNDAPETSAKETSSDLLETLNFLTPDDRFITLPPAPITSVHVRFLDKISCQFLHTSLQIGRLYAFGRLHILIIKAFENPPEERPEVYAFLKMWEVSTSRTAEIEMKGNSWKERTSLSQADAPDAEKTLIFSGWMFASSPAIAPLEHPVYDVRLESNSALP